MASNVKILLVDDNPMVLGMLQQALSALGEVAIATDAADALLKAVDDLPDLMICDYRMPGMDGRQLLEKLKSRPSTPLMDRLRETKRFSRCCAGPREIFRLISRRNPRRRRRP